jgi:quercetin dioxygenase-like cupin family protein
LQSIRFPPAGPAWSFEAGKGELQVVVASRIPLHIHDQDHVVFVASGTGTARIENAAGAIETRPVKPGDIVDIPHGKKHGFEKAGEENLVLLVTTAPSKNPPTFWSDMKRRFEGEAPTGGSSEPAPEGRLP